MRHNIEEDLVENESLDISMNTNDNMRDDIENDRVENESDETINTTAQAGKQKRHRSRNKDINTKKM